MSLYDCQLRLKEHLSSAFTQPDIRTVDILASELESDGIKQTVQLPALFVMFRSGSANFNRPSYEMPVIVAVSSESHSKKTGQRNNLELVSNVSRFLLEHPVFGSELGGAYQIDPEMEVGLYALNARHCVVILHVTVHDNNPAV
ncbi:hypothetical protein JW777_00710 [bacterium]|nr:hypothetical protein [bacterium]